MTWGRSPNRSPPTTTSAHNPESEQVRPDNDGDGRTDRWETNTDRDPKDGRFLFLFDCGGWMTEGWTSTGTDALPGLEGFLNFHLTADKATLTRDGLKLDAARNTSPLTIRARVSAPARLTFETTPASKTQTVELTPAKDFADFALDPDWPAATTAVRLTLDAPAGTRIEIDSIR